MSIKAPLRWKCGPPSSRPGLRHSLRVSQASVKDADGRSSFAGTGSVVKFTIAALTNVVNALVPPSADYVLDNKVDATPITPAEVQEAVRADFTDRCYLWTGKISGEIYDADCVFTDPTLSFKGLKTFERNLASLKPILDNLLVTRGIELASCELDEDRACVVAEWRMTGRFRLPWKPALDLQGRTTFTYDAQLGNRVVRYDEEWGVSAGEALMQLLRPGPS